jgi:hypothetical protein
MIFYGWGRKSIPLTDLGMQPCARCGAVRPFQALLSYRYFHLYWIFCTAFERKYLAVCTICRQGLAVDRSQLPLPPGDDPIPFMQKWGLGVLAVIIAAIVTVVALGR